MDSCWSMEEQTSCMILKRSQKSSLEQEQVHSSEKLVCSSGFVSCEMKLFVEFCEKEKKSGPFMPLMTSNGHKSLL